MTTVTDVPAPRLRPGQTIQVRRLAGDVLDPRAPADGIAQVIKVTTYPADSVVRVITDLGPMMLEYDETVQVCT